MKKKIFIIIGICLVVVFGCVAVWMIENKAQSNKTNGDINNESEIEIKDKVIIKDGKIKNENLLDEFMNFDRNSYKKLEIDNEDGITNLEFINKEIDLNKKNEDGSITTEIPVYTGKMSEDFDIEFAKKYYGYYKITYPNGTIKEFSPLSYNIKKIIKDDKVIVYFYIWLPTVDITVEDFANTICEYSVESSNYKKIVTLNYNQRKDMGINLIADIEEFDNEDYKIFTFGGDVTITVDGDMVYDLKQALNEKVITAEDIIKQVKLDNEYSICNSGMYSDGGSMEYLYDSYTILKCNRLEGNKDLYIGMKGAILSQINKINKQ